MTQAEIAAMVRSVRESEIAHCKKHIEYFIGKYVRIEEKDATKGSTIIPFELWDGQICALHEMQAHKFSIILKARQLGMTWLVLAYALHMMMTREGCTVIAISKTEEESMELVRRLKMMLENMPEMVGEDAYTYRPKALSIAVRYRGGTESIFKAFPASPSAARSFTANLIIFDEWAYQQRAEEIWQSGFPTINRSTGGQVIGLSTMQLGGLFEETWRKNKIFHKIFLPWQTDPARDAEWYARTRAVLGEKIYAEYPATPEEALMAPAGCFFHELDYEVHVAEPFAVPREWRRYHAIDYGLDMLASLWAAVDPEGNVYIYRELYEPELIIPRAAELMREAEAGEEIYMRVCPPDLFGRNSETGRTRAEAFAAEGMAFERASADRAAGWSNLKTWLQVYESAEGIRTSRLKIFRSCENLLRTLRAIQRDKKKPDDCATEPHELTHAPDALRYMMQSWITPETAKDRREYRAYEEAESLLEYGT